ncbi:MAG: CopG family transcriptional regulator [Gulosibacter sp.]|uniref:CopG family transcriptional regulator n=1 Tax=Gulosibacter sp. TaxID=2817531 RepID=UPI003F913429
MRTTIRLDPEVAAAAEALRRERNIGLGEAVNELARAGLAQRQAPARFQQRTASVGVRVDVTNIADTLERIEHCDAEGAQ